MGILKIFFVISLLVLFQIGETLRIELDNGVAIVPLDIGVGAIFLLWLVLLLVKKTKIRGEIKIPISLFVLALILSLLVNFHNLRSTEILVSSLYLLRLVLYVSVYFIVNSLDTKFKKIIPKLMIVSGIFVLIGGYIQYFLYPNLKNLYYLGWDEHLYRMFSTFLDPNFAAAYFCLLFFLVFVLNKKKNQLFILLEVMILGAIYLTFSRAGYLMLATGLFLLFAFTKHKKWIITYAFVFIVLYFISPKIILKSEGTNLTRTASSQSRIESAQKALTIIKDNPIFGVGFNSYRYAQHKYGFIDKNWKNLHSGAGTDNSFLFILATSGIVGFLAFANLLFHIIKISFNERKNFISLIILSSITGLIADSMFLNSLFYPFFIFWIPF